MARDFAGRGERRQDVHETEELRFEMLVPHRPLHQRAVKALLAEERRGFGSLHQRENPFPPLADAGFEIAVLWQVFVPCYSSWRHCRHAAIFLTFGCEA